MTRLEQLASICEELSNQNIAHPDIKLTNFLTDSDGNIIIADKKLFISIDVKGNIHSGEISTSKILAPPEYRNGSKDKEINASAFMTYQLGLALYDYLVLPELSSDRTATPWCMTNPLDFTNPVFQSVDGKNIKVLITKMTDPDPGKRPSLSEVKGELKHLLNPSEPAPPTISQVHVQKADLETSYACRTRGIGRAHDISVQASQFTNIKEQYQALKGDALKTKILDDFKSRIGGTSTMDELQELKSQIKKDPEYTVLNTSQGKITRALQPLGKNTTSINTLNEMFKEQEERLKSSVTIMKP